MKSYAASPPGLTTMVLLVSLALMSMSMFIPSLANMADTFQVDYKVISWSISGYLLVTAGVQLITGPLSDRYGRRPVMLTCLAIFTIASLGCLIATDIRVFLAFRVMQAPIMAASVLAPAILRDTRGSEESASLIGYVGMVIAITPIIAPMIGGLIDEMFDWRGNFALFAFAGLGLFIWCWFRMRETNETVAETFYSQFKSYPDLFKSRRFWGYSLCLSLSVAVFYTFLAGAPFITKILFDMPTSELGFYLGTAPLGYFIGSFLSGRLSSSHDLVLIIVYGRLLTCFGLLAGIILFFNGFISVISLFGTTIFIGIGNGLTRPGCSVGVMSVRPKLAGSATGLMGAMQVTIGAVTTAVLTPDYGLYMLFGIMLFFSLLALASILYVISVDRKEALLNTS